MTKDVGILVLGLLVAAMPFLGFPSGIEQTILVVSGLLIALLAFFIRGDIVHEKNETESYIQNGSMNGGNDGGSEHHEDNEKEGA